MHFRCNIVYELASENKLKRKKNITHWTNCIRDCSRSSQHLNEFSRSKRKKKTTEIQYIVKIMKTNYNIYFSEFEIQVHARKPILQLLYMHVSEIMGWEIHFEVILGVLFVPMWKTSRCSIAIMINEQRHCMLDVIFRRWPPSICARFYFGCCLCCCICCYCCLCMHLWWCAFAYGVQSILPSERTHTHTHSRASNSAKIIPENVMLCNFVAIFDLHIITYCMQMGFCLFFSLPLSNS